MYNQKLFRAVFFAIVTLPALYVSQSDCIYKFNDESGSKYCFYYYTSDQSSDNGVVYGSISGGIIGGVLTLLGIIYIIMKMCHHNHRNKVYSQDKQQPPTGPPPVYTET